jgi:hypothetical protein
VRGRGLRQSGAVEVVRPGDPAVVTTFGEAATNLAARPKTGVWVRGVAVPSDEHERSAPVVLGYRKNEFIPHRPERGARWSRECRPPTFELLPWIGPDVLMLT